MCFHYKFIYKFTQFIFYRLLGELFFFFENVVICNCPQCCDKYLKLIIFLIYFIEDEELFGHLKNPTDEVIHIQKEAGLGGNICTKVIFFLLLGAIGVTVGIILVKYQGSTDGKYY